MKSSSNSAKVQFGTLHKETNSFFGLEEKDMLVGFLYLGYPKTDLPQGKRTPIVNKIRWVK